MSRRRQRAPLRKYEDWPSRVTWRLTEISAYWPYSPCTEPSALSKISSTVAWPTGLRELEPEKITSVSESPRRRLAALSPITQRIASMMLDLPQPLGPSRAVCWPCAMRRLSPCSTFTWPRTTVARSSSINGGGSATGGAAVMALVRGSRLDNSGPQL